MPIVLYHCPGSTPCHAVRMVAKMLGVDLALRRIQILKGEQMKEEFLKLNPLHTVPTIVDGDFALWESRAIITYLCDKYSKDAYIYPRNPRQRADVTKWLIYDAEKTFPKVLNYVMPHWFCKEPTEEARAEMEANLDELDTIFSKSKYLTGEKMTIADISLRCSIGQLDWTYYKIDGRSHLKAWMNEIDALPERRPIRLEYLEYIGHLRETGEIK